MEATTRLGGGSFSGTARELVTERSGSVVTLAADLDGDRAADLEIRVLASWDDLDLNGTLIL